MKYAAASAIWIILFFILSLESYAEKASTQEARSHNDTLPALQHLSTGSLMTNRDSMRIYSLDSATITAPPPRTVLSGQSTPVTIVPRGTVDSVTIFVRHSAKFTDTLAHIAKPPYSTVWNYSHLPDQDQMHLQFGYILHTTNGKSVFSKALPHNWAIDTKKPRRRRTIHCKQLLPPDTIVIDGQFDDWKKIRSTKLGSVGTFSLAWTNSALCFSADITDPSVTATDFVEIHLDPFTTRSILSDERHRSIRFGPASRSYSFTAHPAADSTSYTQCDSIAVLISEGLLWRTVRTSSGYRVEASIPFYAISDSDFPNLRSGVDVTCKTGASPDRFSSWAGSTEFDRYSPANWGSLALHQAMFPLKVAIFTGGLLFSLICGILGALLLYRFIKSEKIESREFKGGSPQMLQIQEHVDTVIAKRPLTVTAIANDLSIPESTITTTLQRELDCTFSQFIDSRRLCKAKQELWNFSLSLETVATHAGFSSVAAMEKKFNHSLHTSPSRYREQALEMATDEDESTGQHIPSPPTTSTEAVS